MNGKKYKVIADLKLGRCHHAFTVTLFLLSMLLSILMIPMLVAGFFDWLDEAIIGVIALLIVPWIGAYLVLLPYIKIVRAWKDSKKDLFVIEASSMIVDKVEVRIRIFTRTFSKIRIKFVHDNQKHILESGQYSDTRTKSLSKRGYERIYTKIGNGRIMIAYSPTTRHVFILK